MPPHLGHAHQNTVDEIFSKPTSGNVRWHKVLTLLEAIDTVGQDTGCRLRIERRPALAGDARHTGADGTRAEALLGYRPQVKLVEGLTAEAAWLSGRRRLASGKVVV
jgi:nucleoside-diphosphate-sugar epimerase